MGQTIPRQQRSFETPAPSDNVQTYAPFIDPNVSKYTEAPKEDVSKDVNKIGFKCVTNEDCMNLDSFSSSVNKGKINMVYSCPSATCNDGVCNCGNDCSLDPYSGVCCQGLDKIGDDVYCIENTNPPERKSDYNIFWNFRR